MNSSEDIFSQMDDEELCHLEQAEHARAGSTTKWWMDKLQNCLRKRNIRCDWTNVEKHLSWILHQFYGEQKNTKNSMASSSTLDGAPFRNCNITVAPHNIRAWRCTRITRHASDPILYDCHSRQDSLPRFSRPFCKIRDRKIVMRCSWHVFAVKCM